MICRWLAKLRLKFNPWGGGGLCNERTCGMICPPECVSVSLCLRHNFANSCFLFNEHVAVYHPSINSDWQRSQRKNTSWQTHQTKNADPNSVPANSSWKANSWARFLQLWPSSLRLLRVQMKGLWEPYFTNPYCVEQVVFFIWHLQRPSVSAEPVLFLSVLKTLQPNLTNTPWHLCQNPVTLR